MSLYLIQQIAKDIRGEMEVIALKENFPNNLRGLCGRASARLFTSLRNFGFQKLWLCLSSWEQFRHCFIQCGNYYVDITATQFEEYQNTKIHIFKNLPPTYYYSITKKFQTVDDFYYRDNITWYPSQRVLTFVDTMVS